MPKFFNEIETNGGRLNRPKFEPIDGAVLLACQHFSPDAMPRIKNMLEVKNNKIREVQYDGLQKFFRG